MKKRGLALALCILLCAPLCFPAAADAGGRDDPLISRSYAEGAFLPETKAALAAAADKALAGLRAESGGAAAFRLAALAPGEGLRLTEGQQLTVASGEVKLYTEAGEAVSVSAGAAAADGVSAPGARIVASEGAVIYADALTDALLKVSASAAETADGCPFRDVVRDAWYHGDVSGAYRRGLVNGVTLTSYEPGGNLTVAQCVKLAACMRQLWDDGAVTLENSPDGEWYESYADYALEHGLMEEPYDDYGAVIDRTEFVRLFYRALPVDAYGQKNAVPDGAIPDLGMEDGAAAEIYAFYRAGILTGYTATPGYAEHAFGPESAVTRAEVATIMNRMFDETARIAFSI